MGRTNPARPHAAPSLSRSQGPQAMHCGAFARCPHPHTLVQVLALQTPPSEQSVAAPP